MRFFNTAGPIRPEKHYCIPPLGRLDLPDVLRLIRDEKYFVLHAPRQTGKTSALLALRDLLNTKGDHREGQRWEDKVFHARRTSHGGAEIDVWGM